MRRVKIAITVDSEVLAEIDRLVRYQVFASRSQAFEVAVKKRLARMSHSRLARESAKLDTTEERALANESYLADVAAPEY
jgi:metal-responsive CopG/Arc/MetJ family transcriptional regulator